jgi:hypothetical protein
MFLLLLPFWLVRIEDGIVAFVVIYLTKHHQHHHYKYYHYKQHHHYKHHCYKHHPQYVGHRDGSVCFIPTGGMYICAFIYK